MSRLILLELDDREVDVLSRLPGWGPRESILVVHSNPNALIRGLADLAEIAVAEGPPAPRGDDEVVVTEHPGPHVRRWIEGWTAVGASVATATAYRSGAKKEGGRSVPASPGPETGIRRPGGDGDRAERQPRPVAERPAPAAVLEAEERERRVSILMNARGGEPEGAKAGAGGPGAPSGVQEEPAPATDAGNSGHGEATPAATPERAAAPSGGNAAPVPVEIWTNPDATFRYLLGEHAARAVLWWDGAEDVWVPWLSFGGSVEPAEAPPDDALEIPAHYGRFRLAGAGRAGATLLLPALARVADDIALRDLADWRRTEDRLVEHRVPAPGDALPVIRGWGERVLEALGADASFVWRETGDSAWELAAARGDGVRFTGELRLADRILASFFDVGGGWCTWSAGFGIRLDAAAPAADPRWGVRWARVKRAAVGERNSRG